MRTMTKTISISLQKLNNMLSYLASVLMDSCLFPRADATMKQEYSYASLLSCGPESLVSGDSHLLLRPSLASCKAIALVCDDQAVSISFLSGFACHGVVYVRGRCTRFVARRLFLRTV